MTASEENNGAKQSVSTPLDPFLEEQTMLILVGLIASGKSTFAEALERYFPRFRRCNQDELGDRQRVEELAYYTLSEGRSPCIDRTNFNAIQRSYWSAIARAFPKTSISIIVFDTPYHVCASRLGRRTSHPTIKNAQEGMPILQRFASDFQLPSPDEGYDHLIYLRPTDRSGPEYTREDILSILERLKVSTRREMGTTVTTRRSIESYFGRAGNSSRTNRARGYRGDDGYQGFSHTRGTLHGSPRFASRVDNSNWRRPSSGADTDRETSDHPRSATLAVVPAMEGSKSRDSAMERHNST